MTAQLGRGFPVLTGKYSTEGTATQAQASIDTTAWQRFSGIDKQIYSTEGQLFKHRQAMKAQLGRGFSVLTGKYTTEETVIDAKAGKKSTPWQRFPIDRHSFSYILYSYIGRSLADVLLF
jgi:hypothetical protein